MFDFIIFSSLVLESSGDWLVGDTLSSKDLASEVYKSKFQCRPQLEGREWLLEYQREQENNQELQDIILKQLDELHEKEKEMKEQYQEKDLQLTQSKEKGETLQFELNKKQEEFTKKEKELSELQQLCHSKKEELAKTENEFKHQLEKKEQKIQEYSHLLQLNKKELEECQDALRTQKLKNESQSIQLLHHSPQGMYCI